MPDKHLDEILEIRASSLPLIAACAAAARPADVPLETGGLEANLGTALHHLAAFMVQGHPLEPATVGAMYDDRIDPDEVEQLARKAWSCWDRIRQFFPKPQVEVFLAHEADGLLMTGHADLMSIVETEHAPDTTEG